METGEPLDPGYVEKAKAFWNNEDVDQVFDVVFKYLENLKAVLKRSGTTDKEYVQAFKLLEHLDCSSSLASLQDQDSSVVQVVIGSERLPADILQHSPSSSCSSSSSFLPPFNGLSSPTAPPAGREELLPPLVPVQLQYHLHTCSKSCLPCLPSMTQSMPLFWGQNPLKIPLLCGFKRLTAMPLISPAKEGVPWDHGDQEQEDVGNWDVIYKAPCGLSLRNHDNVMLFLEATESYDILQVDFFTFNPSVRLDPPSPGGLRQPEQDLSRGAEPIPVELCVGDGGSRPAEFRYRKDRWPHGCFLSRGPKLFKACCDCADGCSDAKRCACVALTSGERHYRHHRLLQANPSGLFECGPWCGCDRSRCQNRLVQRGIRVRLQVFQTENRGWGVRCRDDLDRGTFVCIYAGVVLQRVPNPTEPPPPKLTRSDLPSDDEVEVVTEWLAPPVLEGRRNVLETPPPMSPPTSPPLHVPVIQRPSDSGSSTTDQEEIQAVLVGDLQPTSPSSGDQEQDDKVASMSESAGVNGTKASMSLKRAAKVDEVCFVDASKEGNVSRFINHSCQPNLFIQNVFIDSHDPAFPVIAFFTSRAVVAGTELTWDYSANVQIDALQKQEVSCLCESDNCHGRFTIEENLCDVCEVEGHIATEVE
ncbi:histone-lysine N-methyltransferase SETDB2 isoform X2 [Pelmatolapia mariae]|uniref:histone-lysine N-methyltransferase SETDB2 isoform X2 n=1 Tax=Pelmatolapia mariae TaxID=158779 RepID=UPI002FE5D2BB